MAAEQKLRVFFKEYKSGWDIFLGRDRWEFHEGSYEDAYHRALLIAEKEDLDMVVVDPPDPTAFTMPNGSQTDPRARERKEYLKSIGAKFPGPVEYWAMQGNLPEVQRELDRGHDINEVSESGETPLYSAVASNELLTIEFLLMHGADFYGRSSEGMTALDLARKYNMVEMVQFLERWEKTINK